MVESDPLCINKELIIIVSIINKLLLSQWEQMINVYPTCLLHIKQEYEDLLSY